MNRFTSTLSLVVAFGLFGSVPVGSGRHNNCHEDHEKHSGVVSEINPTRQSILESERPRPP